jgi:hypothetical protein
MQTVKIPGVKRPFKVYKNMLLLSVDSGIPSLDNLVAQDCLLKGDLNQLSTQLCVMMERHGLVASVIMNACAAYVELTGNGSKKN